MASNEKTKTDPKVILLVVAVVLLAALAVWQGIRQMGPGATDVSFNTKIQAPPDSTRPPGYERPDDGIARDKQ